MNRAKVTHKLNRCFCNECTLFAETLGHFDPCSNDPNATDFHIAVEADLNFMMKMMLGSKIQSGLDKIVQSFEDLSNGRMPEGVDPSQFPGSDFFTKR